MAAQIGDLDTVLVVDETGDLKGNREGRRPAPVHGSGRADREPAGRGLLGYADRAGHALIEPQLDRRMIGQAAAAGCRSPGWPQTSSKGQRATARLAAQSWNLRRG